MTSELSPNHADAVLRDVVAEDVTFVVDTYLCDTPLQLRTMKEAMHHGDVHMVGRAARTLCSSSERVGATAVAQIARKLQSVVGYHASVKDVAPLLASLEGAFGVVAPRLMALLQEKISGRGLMVAEGVPA